MRSDNERAAIIRRARDLRDEIQQGVFNAAEYWNSRHPDEPPIDPDPDGQLRRILDGLNRTLAVEDALHSPAAEGGEG